MQADNVDRLDFEAIRSLLPEERRWNLLKSKEIIETAKNSADNVASLEGFFGSIRTAIEQLDKSLLEEDWFMKLSKSHINQETLTIASDEIQVRLQRYGESTQELIVKVLKDCKLEDYWYGSVFSETERNILLDILKAHSRSEKRRFLDLGTGSGRSLELALTALERLNAEGAVSPAKELYGIDLLEKFVHQTQNLLVNRGVPKANIRQADFLRLPEDLKESNFDATWALMNTLFYCTTESDIAIAMRNIESALDDWGIFLFDTVELQHHQGGASSETIRSMEDLKNLYTILSRMYRLEHLSGKTNERCDFSRFPIFDNTSGSGFYKREVITKEYMEYVLKKNRSRLYLVTPDPITKSAHHLDDQTALNLGLQWIKQNELEEYIRKEIVYRRLQENEKNIEPFYLLPPPIQKKLCLSLDVHSSSCDQALREIAIQMARNYTKLYYLYIKKPEFTSNASSRS